MEFDVENLSHFGGLDFGVSRAGLSDYLENHALFSSIYSFWMFGPFPKELSTLSSLRYNILRDEFVRNSYIPVRSLLPKSNPREMDWGDGMAGCGDCHLLPVSLNSRGHATWETYARGGDYQSHHGGVVCIRVDYVFNDLASGNERELVRQAVNNSANFVLNIVRKNHSFMFQSSILRKNLHRENHANDGVGKFTINKTIDNLFKNVDKYSLPLKRTKAKLD